MSSIGLHFYKEEKNNTGVQRFFFSSNIENFYVILSPLRPKKYNTKMLHLYWSLLSNLTNAQSAIWHVDKVRKAEMPQNEAGKNDQKWSEKGKAKT